MQQVLPVAHIYIGECQGGHLGGDREDGPPKKIWGGGDGGANIPPKKSIVTRVTNRYNFISHLTIAILC